MKKKLLSLCFILLCLHSFSQSDNCSSATIISPNAGCVYTAGTSAGATQTIPGCVGTADDDVWYQFTATQTSHQITVSPSAGYDPVLQLFSGGCAVLNNLYCQDLNNTGQPEVINATGLTIGAVYHFRVYHYWAGSGSSTFSVCVSNPATPPVNDNCAGATSITPNSSCVLTAGTSYGATYSSASNCNGTPDDDVWYTFVANSSQQVITVNPSANMDAVVELLSGTCGSLTSLDCIDNSGTGGAESNTEVGLTPGVTYYVRVFDYWSGNGGYPFTICITGAAATGDEPCNAFVLPPVTSDCNYITMSNAGFTASTATAPTPSSCGGSGAQIGGFSASSHDVWFALTVPATGNIYVTSEPNLGGGAITDGVMALYSGACGSLTQIMCDDDYNYPGTSYDLLPYIAATGLTPGTTVYIRYWGYGSNTGNFGLCVSSPTNDACANALYICDLNNYSANTHGYTPDRPCNMRGDAEIGATYSWTPGPTSAGATTFGMGGAWGTGQPNTYTTTYSYDVSIDNNSWIRFTAAATTASFSVTVGDCFSNGGIQMQIFSGTNCCAFTPVSDFDQGNGGFTLNANSLTIGQDYYLMVDGWGGDLCSYTVTANSGVQIPNIVASPATICFGDSTKLSIANASVGSTFLWFPGGQTTQTITVAPPTNMTYSCQISGICGSKQTLSKAVTVNPLPSVLINGAASQTLSICANTATTLTASGGTTYTWSTGANTTTISVTPTATTNTTYTVTSTNASGCKNIATVTIKGLALPSFSVTNAHPNTCNNLKDTLTAVPTPVGTYTYSWSTGASTNSITPTITANTVFTATVTDVNNCKSTLSSTVTVLAVPTVSSNTATICAGQTATLTASGANTYTWNSAATLSSATGTTVTATPTVATNYTITGTAANGCVNTGTTTVTISASPTVGVNSATVCSGTPATLTGTGATTYSWSTAQSGASISVTPTVTTSYTVTGTFGNNCTNTAVSTVSVNPVPTLTAAPTIAPSNCGAATGSITGIGVSGSGSLSYTWTNGSNVVVGNSQNITNMPAGTYNVVVADAHCSATFGPYSITNPGSPAAPSITTNTTTACVGQSINASATSGAPGPTFAWTGPNGFTSSSATFTLNPTQVNQTGVYAVTVSSAGCTSPAATVTLTVNTLPLVTATAANNPYCAGATVNLNGSSASTYTWSGPGAYTSNAQSPAIINSTTLTAGIYTLTATDANGCKNTDTALVSVNITPTLSGVSANNNTLCANQTLQLNATATPTTATVQWSGPNGFSSTSLNPSIPNITTAASGTYSVIATVGNCSSAASTLNITVNPTPLASASVIGSNTVCSGNTVVLQGGVAAAGNSYNWNGLAGTSTQQNYTLTNVQTNETGTYTLVVSNGFNCKDSATTLLTVNQTPMLNGVSAGSYSICENQNLLLNAVATPTTATYQWNGPNGFSSNLATPFIPNVTLAASGVYSVTATFGNCTSPTNTVDIIVIANPAATATVSSHAVCVGSSVTISGSGGVTYSWSGPNGYTSSNANNTFNNAQVSSSGVYTVTALNNNGCFDTDTTSFIVNPTPVITSYTTNTNNNTICNGGSVQLIATVIPATVTPQWTGPNGYSSPPMSTAFTPTVTGTYTVTASIGACQSTGLDTVRVTVNPTPIATATVVGSNTVCSGNTVILQGGVAAAGNSYNWNGPAGTSTQQSYTLTNVQTSASGTYTLVVTNSFNCTASATTSITINQTPIITSYSTDANNNTICLGQSLQLQAAVNPASAQIIWTGPSGFSSPPQSTIIVPTVSGIYTVTAIATPGNCQSAGTNTLQITVNPKPIATASITSTNSIVCSGNTVNLIGGNSGYTNYNWSGPSGYASTNQNNTLANVQANQSGTYTLVVTNSFNCKDTAVTSQLNINQTPGNAVTSNVKTCTGGTLTLNATGNGTINWYSDAALTNLVGTGATFNPTVPSGTTQIFYVAVTSTNNCVSATTTSVSVGNYNVQVGATASVYSGNAPLLVNFSGQIIGSTSTTYSWTLGDNATSTLQNPSHTYNVGGDYIVTLSGIDSASSCIDTAMLTIHVIDDMILVIPNVFTPNGDGVNDGFFVTTKGVKSIEGFIMNRWGQLMFEWTGLNTVWDGKAPNGNVETEGTYFYVIKATSFTGKTETFKGPLTLIR
ncbi:MAG TPA: gliding motility-associated C-terminal domain-containing protein [Bacteroidia bacterium]|nr:gliding motility-associated C-terminal domain-containing protein [Bacteroidia bacterium]